MTKYTYIGLGKRVREERVKLNLSIKELAQKAELTPQCVQYIETGDTFPTMTNFCKLVNALKCSPNQLLERE